MSDTSSIVDTHIHLQHPRYTGDLAAVMERAVAAGVTRAIVPGTTLDDSRSAVRVAASTSSAYALYAAVGIHPTDAHTLTSPTLQELATLATGDRVVAIGEIGLDYYWPNVADRGWTCADPETQRAALLRQLALASDLDLPVIIHDRDAHQDVLEALRRWKARDPRACGTLHAYAGGPALLAEVVALGFHIGIDGPVTFRKATDLQEVARRVPLDRLLLETDGPYLTPVPHRGQRNEPAYLIHLAARIAQLRDLAVGELIAATTTNARELFDLP